MLFGYFEIKKQLSGKAQWIESGFVEITYDLRHQIKTRWAPSHLRNVRIPGWDRILREMKMYWKRETETVIETSFYERLPNAPRPKKPIEGW